jgi:hypothetical protein
MAIIFHFGPSGVKVGLTGRIRGAGQAGLDVDQRFLDEIERV